MGVPGSAAALLFSSPGEGESGYEIARSVRLNPSKSGHLTRTPAVSGDRRRWTWAAWIKSARAASTSNQFGSSNAILFSAGNSGPSDSDYIALWQDAEGRLKLGFWNLGTVFQTTARFEDRSAWYHIILAVDTTQATAANRVKLYVNGTEITQFDTDNRGSIPQNLETAFNSTKTLNIARDGFNNASFYDTYIADLQILDGIVATPSDLGEFSDTGIWQPIEYTGNYNGASSGTVYTGMLTSSNGFATEASLAFDGDISTQARANLSNDNYIEFTPTPPLAFTNGVYVNTYAPNGYSITNYYSVDLNGNGLGSETTFVGGSSGFNGSAWSLVASGNGTLHKLRIRLTRSGSTSAAGLNAIGFGGTGSQYRLVNGAPCVNGAHLTFADNSSDDALGFDTSSSSNTTENEKNFKAITYAGTGSPQGIDLGFKPGLLWIKSRDHATWHTLNDTVRGAGKNIYSNDPYQEQTKTDNVTAVYSNGFSLGSDSNASGVNVSGKSYIAWAWNAGANSNKTYTVKVVSDGGNKYRFDDFGTSAVTLDLAEGSTYVFDQSDSSNSGHPLRFSTTSNGTHGGGSEYTTGVTVTGTPGQAGAKTTITVAAGAPNLAYYCTQHSGMGGNVNTNSTAGASNFDGSVQTVVEANQAKGFSIVTWSVPGSGSIPYTLGHGLGSEPKWILIKSRSGSNTYWTVYHTSMGNQSRMYLNLTIGASSSDSYMNSTSPTSSVITLSSASDYIGDMVAYCWSEIPGFSKFGSFSGSGSAGQGITGLGFKPRFLMIKNKTSSENWVIMDSARDDQLLFANTNGTDASSDVVDFTNDGFTLKQTGSASNASGQTYIYMAFADDVGNHFDVHNVTATGVGVGTAGWPIKVGTPGSTYGTTANTSRTLSSGTSWTTSGNHNTLHIDSEALAPFTITLTKTGGSNEMDFFSSASPNSGYSRVTNNSSSITISSISANQNPSHSRYISIGGSGNGDVVFSVSGTAFGTDGVSIDSLVDSPEQRANQTDDGSGGNIVSNFATLNPKVNSSMYQTKPVTYSLGSLRQTCSTSAWDETTKATSSIGLSSGKWYWEQTISHQDFVYTGIINNDDFYTIYPGAGSSCGFLTSHGLGYGDGSNGINIGDKLNSGDTLMWALDLDNNKLWVGRNGAWLPNSIGTGNPATGANPGWSGFHVPGRIHYPAANAAYNTNISVDWNFGSRKFNYPAPANFKCICAANLNAPLISEGSKHFDIALYTGNGQTNTITGLNHSPDLVWTKNRSTTASHALYDSVRGAGFLLRSNETSAETQAASRFTSFDSNGFSIGSYSVENNASSNSYVSWAWNAGDLVTNSAYNQSQVWSANVVGGRADEPKEDMFDGSVSTFAQNPSGNTNPNTISVTFSNLSYNTSVEVYPWNASSCSINGGSQVTTSNQQWNTLASGSGTLTSLVFQRNHTNGAAVSAIRVDGKLLVDAGVVPAGSLNSSAYDQSQTWSSSLTSSNGFWSGQPATNAFDGNPDNNVTGTNNGGTLTFAPSNYTIPANSTIEIRCSGQSGSGYTVVVNGVSNDIGSGTADAAKFHRVNYDGGTSLSVTVTSKSSYSGDLRGVKVNGKLLVDSGVSVTNVPLIPSTNSANPLAGMSIVKYRGSGGTKSIAHSLGTTPEFIISKKRSATGPWVIFHKGLAIDQAIFLDSYYAQSTDATIWPSAPTNLVVNVNGSNYNNFAEDYISYCFAPVENYSAMGVYPGNGDTYNGPFIPLTFKARFLLLKCFNQAHNWHIFDSERSVNNPHDDALRPNNDSGEVVNYGSAPILFLSNGIKINANWQNVNNANGDFVWIAFAERPFKDTRAF